MVRELENDAPSAVRTKRQQEWAAKFHAQLEHDVADPEPEHAAQPSADDDDDDSPHVRRAPKRRR